MNRITFCFIITFLAGISTIIGILPTFINNKYRNNIINFSLAFSAGIMITISLCSLIPESVGYLAVYFKNFAIFLICFIFVVVGIIISMEIDCLINIKICDNKLYKVGIVSVIALILHNIPEGITTFITTSSNLKLGLSLSLAIALHNIPEGISIAIPIYFATKNRKAAFIYTLISGFSEFFGAIIAYLFISQYVNSLMMAFILAVTAGIMLHISFYELLPNALEIKNKKITNIGTILGIIVMLVCEYIFHV